MAVGRKQRRREREPLFASVFGDVAGLALDLVELTEMAWHDCHGEVTPPDDVIEDMLVVSRGTIDGR